MSNQLEQLKEMTTVVSDTGEFNQIEKYQPKDATTNPSLLYKAVQMEEYKSIVDDAVEFAKKEGGDLDAQVEAAMDKLFVAFGVEILKIIPGRVSTELDARLSFDTEATIAKAKRIAQLYRDAGIDPSERVLLKIATTWEGIKAAEQLEKEGIHCNMTLLFSFPQAVACAEAGVTLISPFVGRILDWYKAKEGKEFAPADDPGVHSVSEIYNYYKAHSYDTIVMGASFRSKGEILELAGVDYLTIAPKLLQELQESEEKVERKLSVDAAKDKARDKVSFDENAFRWAMNEDAMATEKLAEGIRKFGQDIVALEKTIREKLQA